MKTLLAISMIAIALSAFGQSNPSNNRTIPTGLLMFGAGFVGTTASVIYWNNGNKYNNSKKYKFNRTGLLVFSVGTSLVGLSFINNGFAEKGLYDNGKINMTAGITENGYGLTLNF